MLKQIICKDERQALREAIRLYRDNEVDKIVIEKRR